MKGWETAVLFVIIFLVVTTAGFFILQDLQGKKAWESSTWEPPAWAPPNWEVVQPPKGWEPLRWQEAVNHIKSNTDYASYLVMTVSPHIIVDSYGNML